MKKILYTLLLCVSFVVLASCEDETTQDHSLITHYITFEMNGDPEMVIPVGTVYEEPGIVAMEGDEDVTSSITTVGSVDGNSVGVYNLVYSVVNKDGFGSTVSRTVIVYDPSVTEDISGTYTVAPGSNRYTASSGATVAFDGYAITLTQKVPGIFAVSDYMGGYYDQRADYGSQYAMKGYLKLNADNTLEALNGDVAGWGDSLSSFENGVYAPATGTISYELGYASFIFNITLTK